MDWLYPCSVATADSTAGHRDRCGHGRDVELLLEGVNELGELENRHLTNRFEQLFLIRHFSCLLMSTDLVSASGLNL